MQVVQTYRNHSLLFYALCILALSLPILEALKNLSCLLLLIFFIYERIKERKNVLNDFFANTVLIFISLSIIAAIGASLNGYETSKIKDIIRYSLVAWIIIHTTLSQKQIYTLLLLLLASTTIGAIGAYIELWLGTETAFEIRSVGHINHSAIYLLLTLGAILPFLTTKHTTTPKKALLLIFFIFLTIALIKANSRATFLVFLIIAAFAAITTMINNRKVAYIMIGLSLIASTAIYINPPPIIEKIKNAPTVFYSDKKTPREKIWSTAIYAWKKEPLFGIGFGNYQIITPENLEKWHQDKAIDFRNTDQFLYFSHSHNRFINTLAEGGFIGLLGLLIFLYGIIHSLWRYKAHLQDTSIRSTFWFMHLNTLLVIVVVGLFNTTVHHEHGILTMMLLALSYRSLKEPLNKS